MTIDNMPDWGNDAKRKAWLNTYREWNGGAPYSVTPEFDLEWFKCDLPDGRRIVVCERPNIYDDKRTAVYYLLKQPADALLIEYPAGLNIVAEHLKGLNLLRKKGGSAEVHT